MKKIFLFLLCMGILRIPVICQNLPTKIIRLSTYQGLSNSIINGIVQDHHGFIWVATEDGLNKYDGYNFTVFKNNAHDPNSLSNNFISGLYFDAITHRLWISTNEGINIYDYNQETFKRIKSSDTPGSLNWNAISCLCPSKRNILWLGTYGGGIGFIDKKTLKYTRINRANGCTDDFLHNKVMAILEDSQGDVWAGSQETGLYLYKIKENKIYHFPSTGLASGQLPPTAINEIYEDREHHIWIGTNDGLFLFDRPSAKFIAFRNKPGDRNSLASNIVKAIMEDHSGYLWVGSQTGGLGKIKITSEIVHKPSIARFSNIYESEEESGLSYGSVESLFEDQNNNIWVGTYSGGLNFICNTPDKFNRIRQDKNNIQSLSYHKVWGICDDQEGNIWIGTDGGGINKYNPATGKIVKVYRHNDHDPHTISSDAILCAFRDHYGDLWFGTYNGGLNKYDPKNDGFIHYKHDEKNNQSIASNDIRVIYEDPNFHLYVGTNGGGVSVYQPGKETFINASSQELNNYGNSIRAILKDKSGFFWYGAYGNGLVRFKPGEKTFDHFTNNDNHPESIGNNTIHAIHQDKKGQIWVGTEGGGLSLFHPDTRQFENFGETEGLNNLIVRSIGEDMDGYIWLSTNNGISRFSPRDKKFINFDIHDGLAPGEFSDGSYLFSKGTMYFGNQNGLSFFKPASIEQNTSSPKVHIVDIQVFNKSLKVHNPDSNEPVIPKTISETDTLILSYKQSVFTIDFVALNYKSPEKIHYAYYMEGLEKDWIFSGSQHQVTYRNLKKGTYLFRVKASNINGTWNNEYTSLTLIITPPFYDTWWAWLIYLILCSAIAYLIYNYYSNQTALKQNLLYEKITRQKEHQLNQEKIRFFTNITHEFRSPLTLMQGPLEDLLQIREIQPAVSKKIFMIYRNSNRLLELINKLLDFRKIETGAMQLRVVELDFIKAVKEYCYPYRELFREKKIDFSMHMDPEVIMLWFDPDKLMIILNNLLSNASKYTREGGKVWVEVKMDETQSFAILKVTDTGIGIAPNHLEHIFEQYYRIEEIKGVTGTGIGLALTKNLVELHQGDIVAESTPGEGSSFSVRFKTGKTHFTEAQISEVKSYSLPAIQPLIRNKTDQENADLGDQDASADKKRIMLVVEDNDEIRAYVRDSFTDDFRVLEADSGKTGLDLAIKWIPDIIITDIMMPGMDGLELCHHIKSDINTSHIPVIILTARNTIQQKQEGYDTGADSYVTKPFSTALLRSRIHNILNQRKSLTNHISRTILLQPDEIHVNLKDEKFISDCIHIIESRLTDENLDVSCLTEQLGMSRSVLYRKLKALTGMNIAEFIRSIRLRKAAQLLSDHQISISEVAFKVGFNDLKYFRHCFKEQYKVLPSDYQKKPEESD